MTSKELSELRRAEWRNPEIRAARLSKLPRARAAAMKARAENSGNWRRNVSIAQRKRFKDPEQRRLISEKTRLAMTRPEVRERCRAGALIACATGFQSRPEVRAKISAALKGIQRSPEHMAKFQAGRRARAFSDEERRAAGERSRKRWADPEYASRVRRKIFASNGGRPTKPERVVKSLLNKLFPGEYRYVGDGSMIIAGKSPDFVNVNGQKKIIEVFGDYWHQGEDGEDRKSHFGQFGFATLIVWERETKNVRQLRRTLTAFHGD